MLHTVLVSEQPFGLVTDIWHTYDSSLISVNRARDNDTRLSFYQTSDVGEAFRPIVPPSLVTAAYGISWLYLAG